MASKQSVLGLPYLLFLETLSSLAAVIGNLVKNEFGEIIEIISTFG